MIRSRLLVFTQLVLALRVLARIGAAVRATSSASGGPPAARTDAHVTALLPVLDEAARVGPALAGLASQGPSLREILVVDGGSTDATAAAVATAAACDPRIRFLRAPAPPPGWNGKAWQLAYGLAESDADSAWILMTDADVRLRPGLVETALQTMREREADAATFAPQSVLSDGLDGWLHPSFLATLVYRYGPPGGIARRPGDVLASGQCFVARRAQLAATDAIAGARDSRCEDVTIARTLAASGVPVLMAEAGRLARVEMYATGRQTWRDWPRSLPMRDRYRGGLAWATDVATLALVQAAPPFVLAWTTARGETRGTLRRLNVGLVALRLGILVGTARTYRRAPGTYWLSPAADAACVARLVQSAAVRKVRWRGRSLVREGKA